jgi:hypothetical protein
MADSRLHCREAKLGKRSDDSKKEFFEELTGEIRIADCQRVRRRQNWSVRGFSYR